MFFFIIKSCSILLSVHESTNQVLLKFSETCRVVFPTLINFSKIDRYIKEKSKVGRYGLSM